MKPAIPLLILLCCALPAGAQQVADTDFRPPIRQPSAAAGRGPVVLLDEAHTNFHTIDGRYAAFVALLRRDGFVVRPNRAKFERRTLDSARVLVIANALASRNDGNWVLPNPSAFDSTEISAVRDWVRGGGALLLIADHMPFAGAADALASEFGIVFGNGFVFDSAGGQITFRRSDGSLGAHPIVEGRTREERVDSVTSFTGSAFWGGDGSALMTIPGSFDLLLPHRAWVFSDSTARVRAGGMHMGRAFAFGNGRVVVLGEAAMMSAQLAGPERQPMGMNHPRAPQNAQFALNVVRWLARLY